jgi:hypothetical protein
MGQTRPALAQQQGPPHVRAPLQCMRPSRCTCLGARTSTYASGSAIVLARAHSRALRARNARGAGRMQPAIGPPSLTLVGRPETEVRESHERVRSPVQRPRISARPARDCRPRTGLPNESDRFDPPIAARHDRRERAWRAASARAPCSARAARPRRRGRRAARPQARDRASRPVGTERRAHDRRTRCKRGDRGLGFSPRRASTAARSARRRRRAAASGRALPARPTGHRSSPAGAREWP